MEKLKEYKKFGINRLSIGLQSTNNRLLKELGRIHNSKEFLNTYKMARKIGFNNINIDVMLGLPKQTLVTLKHTIKKVISLKPEHISVYSLILEEGTRLEKQIIEGELKMPDEKIERKMYWAAKKMLEKAGFVHYEISNFAKIGHESKHNLDCWNQKEYIGFGIAAHSYIDNIRYSNIENIENYIKNINDGKFENNKFVQEEQTEENKKKEFMMLGLRKIDGVSISEFKSKFGDNPLFIFCMEIDKLTKEELVEVTGDYIRLTDKGLDFANVAFEEFV